MLHVWAKERDFLKATASVPLCFLNPTHPKRSSWPRNQPYLVYQARRLRRRTAAWRAGETWFVCSPFRDYGQVWTTFWTAIVSRSRQDKQYIQSGETLSIVLAIYLQSCLNFFQCISLLIVNANSTTLKSFARKRQLIMVEQFVRNYQNMLSFDFVILTFKFEARLQSSRTGMSMAGQAWGAQEREPWSFCKDPAWV